MPATVTHPHGLEPPVDLSLPPRVLVGQLAEALGNDSAGHICIELLSGADPCLKVAALREVRTAGDGSGPSAQERPARVRRNAVWTLGFVGDTSTSRPLSGCWMTWTWRSTGRRSGRSSGSESAST